MAKITKTEVGSVKKIKTSFSMPEKFKNEKISEESVEFFKDVLSAALRDREYCLKVINTQLKPTHFPRAYLQWSYGVLKKYMDTPKYGGKIPSLKVFKDMLEQDKEVDIDRKAPFFLKIKDLFSRNIQNEEYSLEVIDRAVRRHEFKAIMESSIKQLDEFKDPTTAINSIVNHSFKLSNQKKFEIVDLFSEYKKRQNTRYEVSKNPKLYKRYLLSFLPSLHNCLPGGLMAPMMLSVAAKTGRGKSIATITFGWEAITQGFNVTHVTSENENTQTTGRYDSHITELKYNDIQLAKLSKEDRISYFKKYKQIKEKHKNKIMIVKFSPNEFNAASIGQTLNLLEMQGHKTDFLIVDSPDLMQSVNSSYKDKRLQQASIYWELKCLLEEKKAIGVVTTQLNRMSSDDNPLAEDLSESYDKSRMLDMILVFSQNKTQKTNKEATLAVVKNRDGDVPSGFITIQTNFERMRFTEKPPDDEPTSIDTAETKKTGKGVRLKVIQGGEKDANDPLNKLRDAANNDVPKKIKKKVLKKKNEP